MNLRQMELRCPTAHVVGSTTMEGYELEFRGSNGGAYATIKASPDKVTPVLVWALDDLAERRLDSYEGYPKSYGKAYFHIVLNGIPQRAMAYIMTEGCALGTPDRHYYGGILAGYKAAGFDPAILDEAVRASEPE